MDEDEGKVEGKEGGGGGKALLMSISAEATAELSSLLRQHSRALKTDTLAALDAMVNCGAGTCIVHHYLSICLSVNLSYLILSYLQRPAVQAQADTPIRATLW